MDKKPTPVLLDAHTYCRNNRPALLRDRRCGCFYCQSVFDPAEIREWLIDGVGDPLGTAICPHCGIDSVIGESAGFPLTMTFLTEMYAYWFE